MAPIFEARCNCLLDLDNLAQTEIEKLAAHLKLIGLSKAVVLSVERFGNWVGGRVFVFEDRIVFSMNALNAPFQEDSSDLVIPVSLITGVGLGKMLIFAKTVDCSVLGTTIRFRCSGQNNGRLAAAINPLIDPN